jgi:hypothetical protein
MKKMLVALVAVAGVALVYLMKDDAPAAGSAQAPAVSTAGVSPAGSGPGIVYEDRGHFESFQAATIEAVPEEAREERVGLGDTADLKFNVHDRYGSPRTGAHLKARAFRGNDPPIDLPVNEKGKGKYEVPFTPPGPGQFNVVLSDGQGTPIGAHKVGVVGAVGVDPTLTDPLKLFEADPMTYRARTPGKLHSR